MYDEEIVTGLAEILADEGFDQSSVREYADAYLSSVWQVEDHDAMTTVLTHWVLGEYDTPEEAASVAGDLADWISTARSAIQ